jgi:hypothetical protein
MKTLALIVIPGGYMGKARGFFSQILVVVLMMSLFSGCIPLWVGAGVAGIVGGYAVSPDTVEGTTPHTYEDVWAAAKEIVGIMGRITQESPSGSQLDGVINGANITIVLSSVNVSVTKFSVKARKSFMPKVDIAQDVYAKIINNIQK